MIVAGGTRKLSSLTVEDLITIVEAAREAQPASPVIAGCAYGAHVAWDMARGIEAAGGDGILLLPLHLIAAPQNGIEAHIAPSANPPI